MPKVMGQEFTILTYAMHETVTPVHNASKFTEEGCVTLRVTCGQRAIVLHAMQWRLDT